MIIKGDNFVIGVSSIDSSMINLGKRVWSESLSDSACGCFSFGVFFAWVLVCIHRDFCWVHWLCSSPTMEPYEVKCQGGNPFALANQGYTFSILTLRKLTSNCYIVTYADSHLHTCTYICRIIHNNTMMHEVMNDARRKTQEDFFNNNIYLSLYCKGSKGLFKGCMWEGEGDQT